MKSLFGLVLASLLLAATSASGLLVRGGGTPPPAPPACMITAVALSNNTFTTGSSGAAVGTVSSTTTGTCLSPTYAIVSSGTDNASITCSPTGNTDFALTGTALTATGAAGTAGPHNNVCVSLTIAAATTTSPFVQAFNITGVTIPCVITGVALSNNTYDSGTPNATVGTVSTATTGPCSAPTYAIVSSGTDHSGATCNSTGNTNFTVTGNTVAANGSPGANTYTNVCVQSTISGATGSPFKQAVTITGRPPIAPSALTNMTVVETTGTTQTNVPFTIGIPFATGVIDGNLHVTATLSGTPLTCNEDNRYSDLGNAANGFTPTIRGTTLSCIIPTLTANSTATIALATATGAPGTGTDITAAQIVAAGYDVVATIITNAGTTETASAAAGLAAGTWTNTTTAANLGKWRSGGGYVTDYIVYAPFKSSGGTVDPKGLYAKFDVSCYKAGTGAVSGIGTGSNPILSCHTDIITSNGVAQNTSPLPVDKDLTAYGITLTGGTTTTCGTDWPKTNPTQTLTLSGHSFPVTISIGTPGIVSGLPSNGGSSSPFTVVSIGSTAYLTTTGTLPSPLVAGTPYFTWGYSVGTGSGNTASTPLSTGQNYSLPSIVTSGTQSGTHTFWPATVATITASSALFTADSKGQVVSNEAQGGHLYGVITWIIDSTHAELSIYHPDPGTNTLTSGNYSMYGINHSYASRAHFACDWVGLPTNPKPMRVQNGNVYLGNAWNNTTFTGGPGQYFISSRAIMNYNIAAHPGLSDTSQVFNCPPSEAVTGCNPSQGHNPVAYTPLFAQAGRAVCGVYYGGFIAYQQSSGARGEIYMQPAWVSIGLLKYDSNAPKAIFENSYMDSTHPTSMISSSSGAFPDSTSVSYAYGYGGTILSSLASVGDWQAFDTAGIPTTCWGSWPNSGHASNPHQVPYQMTGDWIYLASAIDNAVSVMGTMGRINNGLGLDEQWLGMHGQGADERSLMWAYMAEGIVTLLLPDVDKFSVVGWLTKANAKTMLENQYVSNGSGTNSYLCGSGSGGVVCPGTIIGLGYGTCPSGATCNPPWPAQSPRFVDKAGGGYGFETLYGLGALAQLYELGMLSANGIDFYTWYATALVTSQTNTTDIGSSLIAVYVEHLDNATENCAAYQLGFTPDRRSWAYCWRNAFVTVFPDEVGTPARFPPGTVSLSGTTTVSGSTITVTLPASGYIASGGTAYYTTGHLITTGGNCQIATVVNATQFTCVVGAPFSGTSFSNTSMAGGDVGPTQQWSIPIGPGGDLEGLENAFLKSVPYLYINIAQVAGNTVDQYLSIPGSSTARTKINTYSGVYGDGYPQQNGCCQWNIAPR